jgi:hypothetical protein
LGLGLLSGLVLVTVGAAPFWTANETEVLRAALNRLFDPGDLTAPRPADLDMVQAAQTYLAHLPRREQLLCRGLFRSLEWECVLTRGTRFTRLAPRDQDAVLAAMATSMLYPRRLAFIGLKQIGAMAYYQHRATWTHLAYPGPWVER